MQVSPDRMPFCETYAKGAPQVVWATLVADLETPVSAMMKLAERRANSFLLRSVEGGSVRGRFSIMGLRPDVIWRFKKKQAEINRQARIQPHAFEPCPEDPLTSFRKLLKESKIDLPESLPPMASGLFGYMGYDAVRLAERIPDENPDDLGVPDGLFLRPTIICIFDRLEDVVTIVNSRSTSRGSFSRGRLRRSPHSAGRRSARFRPEFAAQPSDRRRSDSPARTDVKYNA